MLGVAGNRPAVGSPPEVDNQAALEGTPAEEGNLVAVVDIRAAVVDNLAAVEGIPVAVAGNQAAAVGSLVAVVGIPAEVGNLVVAADNPAEEGSPAARRILAQ